jgi:methyl-accepting chemotaxis protein-1 (serine sensor receptor)
MTIRSRLIIMISFLSLIAVASGMLGLHGMRHANDGLKTVYEDRAVVLERVARIDALLLQNRLSLALAITDPMVDIKAEAARIERNVADIDRAWAAYLAVVRLPAEQRVATAFGAAWAQMKNDALQPAIAALRTGDVEAAKGAQDRTQQQAGAVADRIGAVRRMQVEAARREYDEAVQRYLVLRNVAAVVLLGGTLAAALFGWFLIRVIYRELGGEPVYAADIVRRISAGDLSARIVVRAGNERSLLAAMHAMQRNLTQTIGQINRAAHTISAASTQAAAGSRDLRAQAERQVASLQETAASMEALASTVQQNAAHALDANRLVTSASATARQGGAVVAEAVGRMASVHAAARRVVDIIGVIDGIAFQTSILALNAAVEAARAGEQGRGFAVVAGEVRGLAQRAAEAAREVKALIDDAVGQIDAGAQCVNQAGDTMNDIMASVGRVAQIVGGIATASERQAADIDAINRAIGSIDLVTQRNAELVDDVAGVSASLHEQAVQLDELVTVFRLETPA